MIKVSRLNNEEFVVNADMIEFIEGTPDTVISLISGKKIVVRESVDEIISKVIEYQKLTHSCRYIPVKEAEGELGYMKDKD